VAAKCNEHDGARTEATIDFAPGEIAGARRLGCWTTEAVN
jgi:hypothetical protein